MTTPEIPGKRCMLAGGVTLRTPLVEDADALAHVRVRSAQRGSPDRVPELDAEASNFRREIERATAEETAENWVVAAGEPGPLGYNRIIWWQEADGTWVYLHFGAIDPAYRGQGIGTALLRWSEARIRELANRHNQTQWEYAANADMAEVEAAALLQCEGYRVVYTVLDMEMRDLSSLPAIPPAPDGITLRRAAPDHASAIWSSIQESYVQGRFKYVSTAEDYNAYFHGPAADPDLWMIGWHGAEIAGQVLCRLEGGHGTVYEVSVRPAFRRLGLARALLVRGLHALRERGATSVSVRTVSEFPTCAKDLYGSVGFQVVNELPRYRKQAP